MQFIWDNKKHAYEIQNFQKAFEECQEWIVSEGLVNLIISDSDDRKKVKNARTEIKKKQDQIKSIRLSTNEMVLGEFNKQCKSLEAELNRAYALQTQKMNEFDTANGKEAKEKPLTLTIKSADKSLIEKIKCYALKMGILEEDVKTE